MTDPHPAARPPGADPLRRWEKAGLAGLALLVAGLGVVTEIRSAFLSSRKTDAGVYFRAAWAARVGFDLYTVTDNNGWHYCYPPALALLVAPLADPPPVAPRAGYLPYWLSVAVWFAVGAAAAWLTVHLCARAVLPDAVPGSRRWWYARLVPLYVCAGGVGFTLGRGQVNTLIVALAAAGVAAAVANRRARAGFWLAGAAVVKVFPAYLLLYPAVRRDARALAGAAACLVLFLAVVPALWWGVNGAAAANRRVVELVLLPGATGGGDQTRAPELTGTTSTASQSFQAAVHAWRHPDRATRPPAADRASRLAHWAVSGGLTAVMAWAGWRRLGDRPADHLVYVGGLCALMVLISPVSHMHYYAMGLPLACGLWLRGLAARPGAIAADGPTTAALFAWGVVTALPLFPGPVFDWLRERGVGTAATLGLWALGLRAILADGRAVSRTENATPPVARQAA